MNRSVGGALKYRNYNIYHFLFIKSLAFKIE